VRHAHQSARLNGATIGWLMTDLSQETFRLHEFQSVMARTQQLFGPPQAWQQPTQAFGNTGAATMPLHVVLAAQAWRHGYAPSDLLLSIAGSDSGARSALVLGKDSC